MQVTGRRVFDSSFRAEPWLPSYHTGLQIRLLERVLIKSYYGGSIRVTIRVAVALGLGLRVWFKVSGSVALGLGFRLRGNVGALI